MDPSSYLCGFCKCSLKTFDSKGTPSIEYTVCVNGEGKEKKCPFFVKSSLLKDYCFVLLYNVKKVYKENPPFCEHGNTSTLFLSRSKDNFNRAFFKCANRAVDDPCSYFQWANEELPTSSPSHRTTPGLVTLHKNQYNHHHHHPPNSRRRRGRWSWSFFLTSSGSTGPYYHQMI